MRKLKLDELGRIDVDTYQHIQKIPIIVILDNVRSALNVGSVFRTADSFAIEKIILCGISATPPNREITKTAIGATESVEWMYSENIKETIQSLKSDGYLIIGIEQTDQSIKLQAFDPFDKLAIIFGNEVDGLSNEIMNDLDNCLEIEQYGTKHSLNVSVCAGIVLWELSKRFRLG